MKPPRRGHVRRSPKLAAFGAQIDPLDRFDRLRRSRLTLRQDGEGWVQHQAHAGQHVEHKFEIDLAFWPGARIAAHQASPRLRLTLSKKRANRQFRQGGKV